MSVPELVYEDELVRFAGSWGAQGGVLDPEHFEALYGPWRDVIGEPA